MNSAQEANEQRAYLRKGAKEKRSKLGVLGARREEESEIIHRVFVVSNQLTAPCSLLTDKEVLWVSFYWSFGRS